MNRYFFRGALEAFLLLLPVPTALLLLGTFLPTGLAFLGAGALAAIMIWQIALPAFRG